MTAKLPIVLPGEDAEYAKARISAFKDDLKPQSAIEDYLAGRAAIISLQLDRCDRVIDAKLNELVRYGGFDRDEAEADLVGDLTRQLFWDPRGPLPLYPHFRGFRYTPRISSPESVDDPLNPVRIVNNLEGLYLGCRWLMDRWSDLRQLLMDGLKWQAPDRLRAIRLLGSQPMDALADDRVLMIYLACDAMDPQAPTSLDDMLTETTDDELKRIKERVRDRDGELKKPASPEAGKAVLLALIEQAVGPLTVKLSAHRERRECVKANQAHLMAFDNSPEGELARRYQLAKGREFFRTIATYYKVRREVEAAAEEESAVGGCSESEGDAVPTAGEASVGAESIPLTGPESPGWVQHVDAALAEPGDRPVGSVPPADPEPGEPAILLDACVQPIGASGDESVGCVEARSDPPEREGPNAGDETNPIPATEVGDETNPNPTAEAGDETNPNPPGPPIPPAEEPTQPDLVAAAPARPDPSDPLSPTTLDASRALERPWIC